MIKLRTGLEWARLMHVAITDPKTWDLNDVVSRADFEKLLKGSEFVLVQPETNMAVALMAVIELHGPVSLHKRGDVKVIRTANHFVETDDLLTALNRLRDPSFLPKSINRPPASHPAPQSGGS